MDKWKVWPHLTIVAVLFAVLGGVAAALWVRYEQKASALTVPNAARVERVEGEVGINNALAEAEAANSDWIEATANTPLSVGDRIYTRDGSRASVAFTGRNFARLDGSSALDVLSLSDRRTQLALRDGSAIFDVGDLAPGDLFEVGTPYGAFDLRQPGLYEVGLNDDGSAWISVLSGLAQVAGLAGSGEISKGEVLTLLGQTAAQIALSRIDPGYAGGLVDDYYGYRYPNIYDGRYQDYNAYLNDPYYYDPYRQYSSYQYASDRIPGLYDLDHYGDWQHVNNYGNVWRPRVNEGWAPYQSGYWMNDYPYGLTWVSQEPWGYAPYHYGRWASINNQWYWVPDGVRSEPTYSPALVAFLPLNGEQGVGWVPLAPGDPYPERYYDQNWQPHYVNRADIVPQEVVNLHVPGAVTIVPWNSFDDEIDWRRVRRADRYDRYVASVRPILDPLSDATLRNAVLRSEWERGKIDLPPNVVRRLEDQRVIVGSEVTGFPFRRDRALARRLRVEEIRDDLRRTRLQFRDERREERREQREERREEREERREERQERREDRREERDDRREDRSERALWRQQRGEQHRSRDEARRHFREQQRQFREQVREQHRQFREQQRQQQSEQQRSERRQRRDQEESVRARVRAEQRAQGARVAHEARMRNEAARAEQMRQRQSEREALRQQQRHSREQRRLERRQDWERERQFRMEAKPEPGRRPRVEFKGPPVPVQANPARSRREGDGGAERQQRRAERQAERRQEREQRRADRPRGERRGKERG